MALITPSIEDYAHLLAQAGTELEDQLVREMCEGSLYDFLKEAWPSFDPAPFVGGWHLEAIAEHLEAVNNGQIRKLLINIRPRSGKPVAGTARVLTKHAGLIPLSEIEVGHEVWTHKGRWRCVLDMLPQGVIPVVRLITQRGRSVEASPDHRFLTPDGWREVGSLVPDDVVATVPCREESGFELVSSEEARLLGYLIGDGQCRGTPNVTCGDEVEAVDILKCVESIGFVANEQKYKLLGPDRWLRRISIRAKGPLMGVRKKGLMGPVMQWMTTQGIAGKTSYTKRVPESVMRGSTRVVCNFLGAYWACDGHVHVKASRAERDRGDVRLGCDSVSAGLMEDVQALLLRVGVQATVRKKVVNLKTARQGDTYTSYSLTISTQDDVWRFYNKISIPHSKMAKFQEAFKRRYDFDTVLMGEVVTEVVDSGETECFCLRVEEDHSFTANGFAVHNTGLVAVAWPTWTWALQQDPRFPLRGPGVRFLCGSYGANKAQEDGVTARRLIGSKWYQKLWGDHVSISKDRDNQERYDTTAGGSRINTGIPESLGKGGMIRILDDPHKTDEVESEKIREGVLRAYKEIWSTRSNDPNKGAEVMIMQRQAENDLSGYWLETGGPETVHLCIPAWHEDDRRCQTYVNGHVFWEDPREIDGESFWPERYAPSQRGVDEALGPFGFSGQIQQRPEPRGGGIIRRDWWQPWPPDDAVEKWTTQEGHTRYPEWELVLAYLDTAFTKKETNDWCAMARLGVFGDNAGRPRAMLAGAWRERLNLRELIEKVRDTCRAGKVDILVIENKAGGNWVREELMKELRDGEFIIVLDTPTVDKIARAQAVVPLFVDKMIHAPFMHEHGVWRSWVEMAISEIEKFPMGRHDDITDAVVGGLGYLRRNDLIKLAVEHDEDEREKKTFRGNQGGIASLYGVG